MSTVQLPKLADRCLTRAHDLVVSLRRRGATEAALSLLYEPAKAVWSEPLF